jgi:hypothetical protein
VWPCRGWALWGYGLGVLVRAVGGSGSWGHYALWERGRLEGPHAEEIVEYWRSRLEGLPVLQLETGHPRPRGVGLFVANGRCVVVRGRV